MKLMIISAMLGVSVVMAVVAFWLDWQAGLLMFGAWWLNNIIGKHC